MNILVLEPTPRHLTYSWHNTPLGQPSAIGHVDNSRGPDGSRAALEAVCGAFERDRRRSTPGLIAVRVVHGGEVFPEHTIATPEALDRLASVLPEAPLHLPPVLSLVEACADRFEGVPIALVFQTAFFVGLPARERVYALEPGAAEGARRYGFHGILHEAACLQVARRRPRDGGPPRVLSICLARRPELAAVIGTRPVMVTGGATPLEGLPGETSCGEIDPGLIAVLARRLRWSPEQIDGALARESGLSGLLGRPATLPEVLESTSGDGLLAREVFLHRLLLSAGAGVAAMSGVDAVIFCGPYAHLGESLSPWLSDLCARWRTGPVSVEIFGLPLSQAVAEAALRARSQAADSACVAASDRV
jgi:acetate kinase